MERLVEFARPDESVQRVRRCASPPDVLRESPSKDVLESGRLRIHHPRDRAGGETIAQSPSVRCVDPAVPEPPRVVVQNLFVAAEEENRQRLLFEKRAGPERICEGVHLRGVQGSMVLRECRDNGAHRRHAQSEGRHRRANIRLEIRRSRRLRRLSKFLNELIPCGRDVEHHPLVLLRVMSRKTNIGATYLPRSAASVVWIFSSTTPPNSAPPRSPPSWITRSMSSDACSRSTSSHRSRSFTCAFRSFRNREASS